MCPRSRAISLTSVLGTITHHLMEDPKMGGLWLCLLGRGVVAVVTAITLSTTGCCLVITRLFHLGISERSLINSLSIAAGRRHSTGCHRIDNHPL